MEIEAKTLINIYKANDIIDFRCEIVHSFYENL